MSSWYCLEAFDMGDEPSRFQGLRYRFRDAMAHLGAAANIVTTNGPGGRAGLTASAVCSVTDDPPTLLVCLNQKASVYTTFARNEVLCVNTLGASHEGLSRLFGGRTPQEERFARAKWSTLKTLSPVLTDALASFDCRIVQTTKIGTHAVLFCEVLDIDLQTSRSGLIYFGRRYHPVSVVN
jgi:flavin reductase